MRGPKPTKAKPPVISKQDGTSDSAAEVEQAPSESDVQVDQGS